MGTDNKINPMTMNTPASISGGKSRLLPAFHCTHAFLQTAHTLAVSRSGKRLFSSSLRLPRFFDPVCSRQYRLRFF